MFVGDEHKRLCGRDDHGTQLRIRDDAAEGSSRRARNTSLEKVPSIPGRDALATFGPSSHRHSGRRLNVSHRERMKVLRANQPIFLLA
jgi:hypothetical protein